MSINAVAASLPAGLTVLERGWLSSNNIVMQGAAGAVLIDSGYGNHAPQALALLVAELVAFGAARRQGPHLINACPHPR